MKLVTVVGARPQFIKAAALSRKIRGEHREILVHTGQHFDANMSEVFFREMEIPEPDYNLGISGGSHGQMTAKMLVALEDLLGQESPDALVLYGDTNSTLAGSLAAAKLGIPIFHVEAGNRLGTLNNPEEVNRITTDHLCALGFCAVKSAYDNMCREGLEKRAFLTGNIMYDSFLHFAAKPWNPAAVEDFNGRSVRIPSAYYYLTCHRQENTRDDRALTEILSAMEELDAPVIFPVHPRNRERAVRLVSELRLKNTILTQPVGYSDSVHLTLHARKIVTDSGGLQCEAFYAGVQCVTIFDYVAWPETMTANRNQLAKAERDDILRKLSAEQTIDPSYQPFGDGHAAEKICERIQIWETSM